jgi:hypothetical protein
MIETTAAAATVRMMLRSRSTAPFASTTSIDFLDRLV